MEWWGDLASSPWGIRSAIACRPPIPSFDFISIHCIFSCNRLVHVAVLRHSPYLVILDVAVVINYRRVFPPLPLGVAVAISYG